MSRPSGRGSASDETLDSRHVYGAISAISGPSPPRIEIL